MYDVQPQYDQEAEKPKEDPAPEESLVEKHDDQSRGDKGGDIPGPGPGPGPVHSAVEQERGPGQGFHGVERERGGDGEQGWQWQRRGGMGPGVPGEGGGINRPQVLDATVYSKASYLRQHYSMLTEALI